MKGFRLFIPNSKRLVELHKEVANVSQNFHLRSIIKNNWELFLADSIHLLTIMLADKQYNCNNLTDNQAQLLIQNSMHEFIPVMEATLMQDIEGYASALSGRSNNHVYTHDMIDSMIRDYEDWLLCHYKHDQKSVVSLLIETIMQEHLDKNLPSLIYCVKKHNEQETFPDLNINTSSPRQMFLNVSW